MSAPLPYDEDARLRELFSYAVLDTGPEPEFDRITRLAARMLRASLAFISFVDRDREWFKSRFGTDLRQTERRHAICALALHDSATLVVPDILLDPRFEGVRSVKEFSQVRFYAGAALLSPFGYRLGSLCVLDDKPRHPTPEEMAILEDLAALVVDQLGARQSRQNSLTARETQSRMDSHLVSLHEDPPSKADQGSPALASTEARYRSIFENALEGIYQTLPDGRFLSVNPAFAHLLGYASPEALMESIGHAALLFVDRDRREEFRRCMDTEGRVKDWEIQLYRSNGSRVWITENARAIRDKEGVLLRYEGTIEDITARKMSEDAIQRAHDDLEGRVRSRTAELAMLNGTLRQQIEEREAAEAVARRGESKFRALIENAQDLITIITPDGTILYQSPSAGHLLGLPVEGAVGVNVFERTRLHREDHEPLRRMLAQFADGETSHVRIELRLRHRDGSWRLLESIGSLLPPDSPVLGVVLNSRDITERRRAELAHEARTRQQTAMAELGRCALLGLELPTILDKTAELVARALEIRLTTVTEVTPDPSRLLIRAGTGWEAGVVGHVLVRSWRAGLPEGHVAEAPLVIEDLRLTPNYLQGVLVADDHSPPLSAVSVLVGRGEEMFGTLCALSEEPRRFSPLDVTFLQTMADLLSTIIRSKHHEAASREVEARYQRIAAHSPGMVFQYVVHADGSLSLPFVSEACRSLYGLEPAQLQAEPKRMGRMVHPDDKESYRQAMTQAFERLESYHWEGRILLASGQIRWVAARARPELLPNGDLIWDGVVLDVSELKRAQEAMFAAKEEAERANAAKSEFLSRMSHELRTPLNAILGFGQLLALDRLNPMQTSSVEQILKGGHHLLNLINEVLDIARIEAGSMEMNIEPVDVRAVLDEALVFAAPLAEQHRVRFVQRATHGSGLTVLADRGRLHQVLLNLLSNAIKYNRENGEVRVGARRLGSGEVRISVSDTGLGIDQDKLGELFTPFQRLDAPNLGIDGTGIGLAISKSLVEVMGGRIGVESSPRRGSTFFFDLPLATDPVISAPAETLTAVVDGPHARDSPSVRTVLHIDDQPANRALVERVLENRPKLRLFSAVDGLTGLAAAREHSPHLILLDLNLPDMNGDEVVHRLRSEEATRHVPVLILSADATPPQVARLRQLGVRDYVTKPFRLQALLEAIETILNPPAPAGPPAA